MRIKIDLPHRERQSLAEAIAEAFGEDDFKPTKAMAYRRQYLPPREARLSSTTAA